VKGHSNEKAPWDSLRKQKGLRKKKDGFATSLCTTDALKPIEKTKSKACLEFASFTPTPHVEVSLLHRADHNVNRSYFSYERFAGFARFAS
jgi:hypothetical protein